MSAAQRRRPKANCRECGEPSGRRAICSRCDVRRPTGEHRDKYASNRQENETIMKPLISITEDELRFARNNAPICQDCHAEPVFVVWKGKAHDWDYCMGHNLDCPQIAGQLLDA